MELLFLLGLMAFVVGALLVEHWFKTRCPSCRKTWRETGQRKAPASSGEDTPT